MVLVRLQAGATVIHQGALPGPRDCMYLLASGSVDIVITGGGHQGGKNEVRVVSSVPGRIGGKVLSGRPASSWAFTVRKSNCASLC